MKVEMPSLEETSVKKILRGKVSWLCKEVEGNIRWS
jgi:hypothetical protein